MSKSIKRPAFFKVFLEHFSSEMMKIPTDFCNNLANKKSKVVNLTGPNDNTWKMDLIKSQEKEGQALFLGGEGWITFWKHHNIVTGDFLVFKFEGEINFKDVKKMDENVELDQWSSFLKLKVKIYDPTYCEKKKIAAKPFKATTDLVQFKVKEEEEALYAQPLATQLPIHRVREPCSAVSFPGFVGLIKKRRYYMIDEEFKREYLSEYGYSTQVVASFGEDASKEWSMTMVRHQDRDESMKIQKGWRKFAQDNHLRVGDMLRFVMVAHFQFHLHKLQP